MCNGYTPKQVCLMNQLRKLWEQHVYWTRFFIISTADDLGDLIPVTNRLMQNPKDFTRIFKPIYGIRKAKQLEELLTRHLQIAGELVSHVKNQKIEEANDARERWYKNADKIAEFLSNINSCWSEEEWKRMLYDHLKMTEREAVLRLQGNYTEDIKVFNAIESQALEMADYMFCGIVKQGFC